LTSLHLCCEEPKAIEHSAELFYLQGSRFVESGDTASTERAFRQTWELDPTHPRYVHDLTVLYIHQHQFAKALDILRAYVKHAGPTATGWTLQGELLFEQQQYDLAYQSLRSALDISNDNYRAHELLGLFFPIYSAAAGDCRAATQVGSGAAVGSRAMLVFTRRRMNKPRMHWARNIFRFRIEARAVKNGANCKSSAGSSGGRSGGLDAKDESVFSSGGMDWRVAGIRVCRECGGG